MNDIANYIKEQHNEVHQKILNIDIMLKSSKQMDKQQKDKILLEKNKLTALKKNIQQINKEKKWTKFN